MSMIEHRTANRNGRDILRRAGLIRLGSRSQSERDQGGASYGFSHAKRDVARWNPIRLPNHVSKQVVSLTDLLFRSFPESNRRGMDPRLRRFGAKPGDWIAEFVAPDALQTHSRIRVFELYLVREPTWITSIPPSAPHFSCVLRPLFWPTRNALLVYVPLTRLRLSCLLCDSIRSYRVYRDHCLTCCRHRTPY